MSQEDVRLVRRAVEAFNRRDLEAMAAYSHDDLEFVSVMAAVDAEAARFRGRDTWVSYFAFMDEIWDGWRMEDIQVWDAGDNRVAATFHIHGTGRQSGARLSREVGITHEIRAGKLWRMRSYLVPSDALKAVGLEE